MTPNVSSACLFVHVHGDDLVERMVALLNGTGIRTGIRTNTLVLTSPELGFGELDRSATTRIIEI